MRRSHIYTLVEKVIEKDSSDKHVGRSLVHGQSQLPIVQVQMSDVPAEHVHDVFLGCRVLLNKIWKMFTVKVKVA